MRGYNRFTLARVNRRVAEGEPGMYPDGDGLYLSISRRGTASWVFRYMFGGKSHEMGLGPVRDVGLARARELAYDARRLKRSGVAPLAAKRQGSDGRPRQDDDLRTMRQGVHHRASGRLAVGATQQWVRSLETHVFPVIGPAGAVDRYRGGDARGRAAVGIGDRDREPRDSPRPGEDMRIPQRREPGKMNAGISKTCCPRTRR